MATSYGNEEYEHDTYTVVSRPASNRTYRIGVLLNSKGNVVRTCGHSRMHTTSKAAVDCMKNGVKNTDFNVT